MAQWELFSANCYRSWLFPKECVTIMHNKMDHTKTTFLVFLYMTKLRGGLMKLLVLVTSMLAHGHGDVSYVHYGLDIFAHDSNYIVDSFTKLL